MLSTRSIQLALALVATVCAANPVFAKDDAGAGKGSTAQVQDVLNTLKARGTFHNFIDGLQSAFNLDNELKGKGPYTVFAANDKAWAKVPEADKQSLFGNPKKLKQVLSYHIVKGKKLTLEQLGTMKDVQTLEGHMLKLSETKNGTATVLGVNNSKVKRGNIEATNGIIHVVDAPLMPPLAK